MKTVKRLFLIILSAVFLLNSTSASTVIDKNKRKVSDFSGIDVSSGIDLYITMGDKEEVTIVASDDIIDDIITEVKDGVLKIYLKKQFRWRWNIERKAYVSIKQLNRIHASAGSDVESENTIEGEDLSIKASSGSDVKMDVRYKSIKVSSSSGSDIKLSGLAKNFEASASSGSDIKASELKTKYCKIDVSSGSDASVFVTEELYARASSGGDIRYSGDPDHKDIQESSGGDIYKR